MTGVAKLSEAQRYTLRVLYEHRVSGGVWLNELRGHAILPKSVRALERMSLVVVGDHKASLAEAGLPIGAEEYAEHVRQRNERREQRRIMECEEAVRGARSGLALALRGSDHDERVAAAEAVERALDALDEARGRRG